MSFKDSEKHGKIRIKQIILSDATLKDASIMSRIDLRAFEHAPNRSVFLPQCAGMFGETLYQAAQKNGEKELRMDIVGTDFVVKATVQYENEDGQLLEALAGFGRWTSPFGSRRRTIWEWILSTVVLPICNYFSPIEELPVETKRQIKEVFQYQLNATFGPGGKGYRRRYWYLHLLCVDPDWQGFGIGSKLLEWSCEHAAQSDSLIYVESSPMALPFYLSKGFQVTSTYSKVINGIELCVPGMIWEPTILRPAKRAVRRPGVVVSTLELMIFSLFSKRISKKKIDGSL